MNVLGQFLDARDDDRQADAAARERSGRDAKGEEALRIWLNGGRSDAERLLAFDAWLRAELGSCLVWPSDEATARRQLEQCRVYLERVVLDLWRRGWFLDGRALATRIRDLLDTVGRYQRAGKVLNFWAYFQATVDRYVGLNAEELQDEARRAGAHVGQILAAALRQADRQAPRIGDLVQARHEETLREKLAAERARKGRCNADAGQGQLF